jgi:hypothetical protein
MESFEEYCTAIYAGQPLRCCRFVQHALTRSGSSSVTCEQRAMMYAIEWRCTLGEDMWGRRCSILVKATMADAGQNMGWYRLEYDYAG